MEREVIYDDEKFFITRDDDKTEYILTHAESGKNLTIVYDCLRDNFKTKYQGVTLLMGETLYSSITTACVSILREFDMLWTMDDWFKENGSRVYRSKTYATNLNQNGKANKGSSEVELSKIKVIS